MTPRRARVWTRSGFAAAVLGVAAWVGGWRLGWVELMVLAAGCLVALVLAVPFVISRMRLELHRTISPAKVRAGDPAFADLVARNPHSLAIRPTTVEERIAGATTPISIPRLDGNSEHHVRYPLPTERRGLVTVGPAVVSRSDPLGLLRRDVAHSSVESLWVHPRWRLVRPLPAGFAKDLEGPTADNSPAGDIAFHAVRSYQLGDDPRHIHWLSSARAGQVMVRHYVDNRRPHVTVVVDATPSSYGASGAADAAEFDTAIDVAASLAVTMLANGLPVSVRVGGQWIVGRANPGDRQMTLDRLTTVALAAGDPLVVTVSDALRVEPTTSVLVVVTTSRALDQTVRSVAAARRSAKVVEVDVLADPGEIHRTQVPGSRLLRAADVDVFAAGWDRMVSR